MKVSEAMTAQVVTAKPTDSVRSVARIMQQVDTGAVPIFDEGKVVGLVTDRDIVLRIVAEGGDIEGPVSGAMSDHVQSCKEDDNVADAAGQMAHHQLRRLIVTNDAGKLVGILSLGDIAVDYGNKKVGQVLEEISAD
ncbi:MAG: putative signal transduction protein with domain [Caulobacteraceae bacterium]|nr:putative signal transduction protein with domain [Caulobacteraceae bacterium]